MTAPYHYVIPHMVSDGFGNYWECSKGRPEAGCHMEVVRPGKVQCVLCDQHGTGPACTAAPDMAAPHKEKP